MHALTTHPLNESTVSLYMCDQMVFCHFSCCCPLSCSELTTLPRFTRSSTRLFFAYIAV